MFIAMNRFKVIRGAEADFEEVWTRRDTQLRDVPGFLSFHLLRGPEREVHTLYSSHTSWRSRAVSRRGRDRRRSGWRIAMRAAIVRFIWGIPNSRVSR